MVNLKGGDHLGNLDRDGRIILRLALKYNVTLSKAISSG
jgi:hypothetical protein